MDIYYFAGSDSSSHNETATLSFENFTGSPPVSTYSFFGIGDAGSVLTFEDDENYTNAISFTAMEYDFTPAWNPTNASKTFTSQSSLGIPVSFSYATTQTTDPGPFVNLSAPQLAISPVLDQIIISWPPSDAGWTLQTNANLATGAWGNYLGTVVNNTITNTPSKGNLFLRLIQ